MGCPITTLHVTNTGDSSGSIILTKWIPVKEIVDGKRMYKWPPDTPIGFDLWIPNVLDLKEDEETVPVEIVASDKETGLWLVCYDDYFGDEQHLYAHKPRFVEGTKKLDWEYEDSEENDFDMGLHVAVDSIKMKAGDGPIPVTLIRKNK
jgi:hypothetical protein